MQIKNDHCNYPCEDLTPQNLQPHNMHFKEISTQLINRLWAVNIWLHSIDNLQCVNIVLTGAIIYYKNSRPDGRKQSTGLHTEGISV